jgi:hypothetical protein
MSGAGGSRRDRSNEARVCHRMGRSDLDAVGTRLGLRERGLRGRRQESAGRVVERLAPTFVAHKAPWPVFGVVEPFVMDPERVGMPAPRARHADPRTRAPLTWRAPGLVVTRSMAMNVCAASVVAVLSTPQVRSSARMKAQKSRDSYTPARASIRRLKACEVDILTVASCRRGT